MRRADHLSSAAALLWDALGIHVPVFGVLTSGMVLAPGAPPACPPDPPDRGAGAGVADRCAVAGPVTIVDVLAAVESVLAAIEVADSRYRDRFRPSDSIGGNAGAARLEPGARARPPTDLEDLRLVGCVYRERGEFVGTAAAGAARVHPATGLVWLVNELAAKGPRSCQPEASCSPVVSHRWCRCVWVRR